MVLDYVDLFAGPGGWDVAARALGLQGLGVEYDDAACATRRAAGLPTHQGDVAKLRPDHFPARVLIASPPCQTFSISGKGEGRAALDDVLLAMAQVAAYGEVATIFADERTGLVVEPLRWAEAMMAAGDPYEHIVLEQVPTVKPVWEAMAGHLQAMGYQTAVLSLHSEQYGVPQTRNRTVLLARLEAAPVLPVATHSHYHKRQPAKMDPGVLPWVSMADGLGWTDVAGEYARREMNQSGNVFDPLWPTKRPALTIAGRQLVPMPGTTANAVNGSTKSRNDGLWVDVWEAGVLQSFPADYPWQGSKSKQIEQVGNAVPPGMARAVLQTVL